MANRARSAVCSDSVPRLLMIANLGKRPGTVLILVAVVAFQVVSFDRVLGLSETWTDAPVVSDDFAYHYANALTVRKFLRAGRWWGYDPTLYAGYPAGILSIDNRALELPTALLPLHPAVVQKLYLLAFWLSVPLMGWATARFAGFGRSVAGITAVLAVLLAECSLMHFMFRWWGMIAFAWACLLAPLVAMLWWALLRRWSLGRLLALTGATQILCLMHALGPFLAVVPVLLAAAIRAGALRGRQVGQLGICIAALVVVNLTWAIPQLDFFGHVTTGGHSLRILQAGGLADAWAILVLGRNPLEFGLHFPLFHSVLLVLGLVGVVLPGSPGGGRARWPLGVGAVALLILTFSGSAFPAVRESQPLRYLPAAYAFLLPLVARTLAWGSVRLPWRAATVPAAIMIVIALAYGPVLSPMAARVFGPRLVPYLVGIPQEVSAVVDLLSRHTTSTARVLVEDSGGESSHQYGGSHATALLPHLLEREYFIGPAPYVPLQEDALVLIECRIGSRQVERMPPADLRAYFDRYNIGWIVAWSPGCKARFSKLPFTRPVATEDRFTLYEVRRSHSFFLAGSGNVEATYDRLTLTGLTPGETVVLSYHYLDRLRTSSGHELVRHEDPADPIGFIEIRDVPESLVIHP